MTVPAAFIEGLRRVRRAPWLIAGLWGGTLVVALPLAILLGTRISASLGSSLAAERAAAGVNFNWWNEFLAEADGLSRSFVPSIIGFAAVLKNLSAVADAELPPLTVLLAATSHGVLALFLLGGVLDRLARRRPVGSRAFFGACGVFFFRFVRLALISGVIYALLFFWLHPWLFETIYTAWTRNVTVERTAVAYRFLLYAAFGAFLLGVNLLFDYAKIRMVVEDRRSAAGALLAGARFIRRNPGATVGLYLLDAGLFLLVLAVYLLVARPLEDRAALWGLIVVGQIYIALRVVVRLQFAASQIALFQGRLAHAGYIAAPMPGWPDSPSAEIIRPEQIGP